MKIYGLFHNNLPENSEPITIARAESLEEAIMRFADVKRLNESKFLEIFVVREIKKKSN